MSISARLAVLPGLLIACFVSPVLAVPDYWDPRLNDICDLRLIDVASQVPQGQGYWRLKEGRFENEVEAGGNHVIFYKCLDINGNPIENQQCFQTWPYGNTTINQSQCSGTNWTCAYTKGSFDSYWGNAAIWGGCPSNGCQWAYNAFISEVSSPRGYVGLSDKVIGMGMTNPQGTPCNAHVNFRLLYQWTVAGPPPTPQLSRSPASFIHTITQGDNLPNDTLSVWNSGGSTLNYSITDDATWLSVNPAAGSSTGLPANQIAVIYTASDLGIGTYYATITITANAPNSPQTVSVTLTVEPKSVPGDFNDDGDVDQEDFGVFQACLSGEARPYAPGCGGANLDGDIDVDQDDFEIFQGCMTGPGVQGDPDCAGQ